MRLLRNFYGTRFNLSGICFRKMTFFHLGFPEISVHKIADEIKNAG